MRRGVFWFDPGVSTGMAWGIFDLRSNTVADAMRTREASESFTFKTDGHEPPDAVVAAQATFMAWRRFANICVGAGLSPNEITLGAEHFILRPGPHTPGTEGIFPAFILGAFEGYRVGMIDRHSSSDNFVALTLQPAGKGKKFDVQQYLKPWGAWVVGKEHERTAFAHIGAYLMDKLL